MLTFSSFPAGHRGTLPSRTVTREEIIAFARQFDPQPFHLDEAAAAASPLGGLAASGWHTAAILMRMIWDGYLHETAGLGSPGLNDLRWLKPVRAGDTLSATYEVTEARVSRSRPGVGICRVLYDMRNQAGDSVMTWDCVQFFSLAPTDSPPGSRPVGAGISNEPSKEPPAQPLKATAAGGRLPAGESPAASKESPGASKGNLYLEDYTPGEVAELGTHVFTAEGIKAFAEQFDPQPFHLDEAAAARSLFGGLSASGWHTAAVWMKHMVAYQAAAMARVAAEGRRPGRLGPSPGFRDLQWREPVRAGDAIAYTTRVLKTEDRPNRPGWGLLTMANEGRNQHGRVVFSFEGRVLVEERKP